MSINFTTSRRALNPFVLYFYTFGINGGEGKGVEKKQVKFRDQGGGLTGPGL
jgi:hypothetical protein